MPNPANNPLPYPTSAAVGVALAGGRSTRMGRDKALVPLDGIPLVFHTIRALAHVFHEIIIVGRDPAWWESLSGVPGWADTAGIRSVSDRMPGKGPLGGLAAALMEAEGRPLFLAGCDMPFLHPPAVRLVLECLQEKDAAVPVVNGMMQPLHAAYSPSCLPVVQRQLDAGLLSMRSLLESLSTRFLDETLLQQVDPELQSMRSLNRPEDLGG